MSKSWSSTLKLPKSTFPPRPLPETRPIYLQKSTDELYRWQKANRPADKQRPPFVVHDGPPYANGRLHVGHALNKILKDMTLRVKIQQGRRVDYRPGWDCHGLPIELKALAAAGKGDAGAGSDLTSVGIRKIARDLASRTVLDQMDEFRSFGVMADWDGRWTTMDPEYEVRQLRLFQTLVQRGLIYRKYKPVYWSPSSHTALAEAELEYSENHISTAAYVKFPLQVPSGQSLPASLSSLADGSAFSFVIWTTTPWTLPANEAIAVHRDFDYAVIRLGDSPDLLIIAESCLDSFTAQCCSGEDTPQPTVVARSIRGEDLICLNYTNPLRGQSAKLQPVIHADFVTAGSGSGLVHIAPGHGFDDYIVCMGLNLPVPAPVDGEGKFTAEAYPDDPSKLEGLSVQGEGGPAVLALLGDDAVIKTHKYRHKYPYDWRTKKPIIVRATAQWFADVAHIKKPAIASLQNVQFVPETGRSRLESFVNGRSEWCISRQRAWGVPIPALYGDDGSVVLTEASVEHIRSVVQDRGTDAWWSDAADEPAWVPKSLRQANPGVSYTRGTDTMDVWFDSGSSWTQSPVEASENGGSAVPMQADVYLEGSDQHRGWFQSSLLTRVAALSGGSAFDNSSTVSPFKTLVTHGFMLDGEGKKMSKSLGNIVTGAQVMDGTLLPPVKEKKRRKKKGEAAPAPAAPPKPPGTLTYDALGPDALRLWVAGSDYTGDVVMSESVLQTTHSALIKYRVMLKMLLGSMQSEVAARQSPITVLDRIALVQLQDTMKEVGAAYDRFEFYRGVAAINHWVTNDLSAFYLEAAKDRLYCADGGGVLEPIFLGLTRMLAPVVPMLITEAWDHAPAWLQQAHPHPLQQLYADPVIDPLRLQATAGSAPTDEELRRALPAISAAHAAVKAGLERARNDKVVGSSLQCSVTLRVTHAATLETLQAFAVDLDTLFVVSSVELVDGAETGSTETPEWEYVAAFDGGEAVVRPPKQGKCNRCWRYVAEPEEEICGRCAEVVAEVASEAV